MRPSYLFVVKQHLVRILQLLLCVVNDREGLGFSIKCLAYLAKIRYYFKTMAKGQDNLIQLKNKETGEVYWTSKNKKLVTRKIELKKYSKKLRKHITFKETKK